jgi:hypothetical protein
MPRKIKIKGDKYIAEVVYTENPIRIDWGRESPNVGAQ